MNNYLNPKHQRRYVTYQGQKIIVHNDEDFEGMRRAGRLAAETLQFIAPFVKPDISTGKIDDKCHDFILAHNAIPAPLNYKGFPKSICTSVNHVVCHGIPSYDKVLQSGDIVNVDITVILDGWFGDTSRTFAVGEVSLRAKSLIDITYNSMMKGIHEVRPGAYLGDIGHAIQSYVEEHRYSVVRDFCGHGIGLEFHMAPNVLHFGLPATGIVLQQGMFFTIEPMINIGRSEIKILKDGWTAVTRDKSLSAQFEHTIGVTSTGYEIFTSI